MNRRFDAQGITCSLCGPVISLHEADGSLIDIKDVFSKTAKLLIEGNIFAIKGIGGIHLASLATDDDIIKEFRRRKDRPYQPFAIMSPDIKDVKSYAYVNRDEEKLLTSWRKPIVLLRKKDKIISDLVAPGLNTIGVMLPYTGIQVMLFKKLKNKSALVMTSGNKPELPISIKNQQAFKELEGIADYFLLHNREIVNRADDSVLRVIDGKNAFSRRSRGYVPDPIEIPIKKGVAFAVGAELNNTAVLITEGKAFTTQYLGDITTLESLEFEK